jgi:hypothetical protein
MSERRKISLFSNFGQIRLGPEQLLRLRILEGHGSLGASAELGSAFMDGNGVERNISRAQQHFNTGARKGCTFCSFRIAEHGFLETLHRNPAASHELRTYFDGMWAAAKSGVGEAYVALHFCIKKLAQSSQGKPDWIAPSTEDAVRKFLAALEASYIYNAGGDARHCLEQLEALAAIGFIPAFYVASFVANEGCQDEQRSGLNLRAAIERGHSDALRLFAHNVHEMGKPNEGLDLLEICAEYGEGLAALKLSHIESEQGKEKQAEDRVTRLFKDPPREFDSVALLFLETFIAAKAVRLEDAQMRASGKRLYAMLADLSIPSAIAFIQQHRLHELNPRFIEGKLGPAETQLEQAKAVGKMFYAALLGEGKAWFSLMAIHMSGQLCGHKGIFSRETPNEERRDIAQAGLICGLYAERFMGELEEGAGQILNLIKQGFAGPDGQDTTASWTQKYVDKQFQETAKHISFLGQQSKYGHGLTPPDRLIAEAAHPTLRTNETDYPGIPLQDEDNFNWPKYCTKPPALLSKCPIPLTYESQEASFDPVCREMHRHLGMSEIEAARCAMSFDEHVVARLMTLAVGLYHAGLKPEATDLLFFVCFHLKGQYGQAHHMLAWVLHETGRTSDAVLIMSDCFSATTFNQAGCTTDLVEFNLLLAELLAYLNRPGESTQVAAGINKYQQKQGMSVDARLSRLQEYRHFNIGTLYQLGLMSTSHPNVSANIKHFENSGHSLPKISLDNMDRYRCLFLGPNTGSAPASAKVQ